MCCSRAGSVVDKTTHLGTLYCMLSLQVWCQRLSFQQCTAWQMGYVAMLLLHYGITCSDWLWCTDANLYTVQTKRSVGAGMKVLNRITSCLANSDMFSITNFIMWYNTMATFSSAFRLWHSCVLHAVFPTSQSVALLTPFSTQQLSTTPWRHLPSCRLYGFCAFGLILSPFSHFSFYVRVIG